ncbi:MAG: hypothetical protein QW165_04035 [Candidatus Woesearchaeota archaeon]
MKAIVLIILATLAACAPATVEKNKTIATPAPQIKANLTLQDVLNEFEALDAQYNTSWKEEHIPKKMIPAQALQPWTDRTLALRNLIPEHSLSHELIQARLEMLSAQTAMYLGKTIGEKANVPYTIMGERVTVGEIDCANAKHISDALRLYQMAYHSVKRFMGHMDTVLQYEPGVRNKIGIDKTRMPFYESEFPYAGKRIRETAKALKEQCNVNVPIEPEPEIPTNLPRA